MLMDIDKQRPVSTFYPSSLCSEGLWRNRPGTMIKGRNVFVLVRLVLLQKKHGPIVLCALVLEVKPMTLCLGCKKRNILGVEATQE